MRARSFCELKPIQAAYSSSLNSSSIAGPRPGRSRDEWHTALELRYVAPFSGSTLPEGRCTAELKDYPASPKKISIA